MNDSKPTVIELFSGAGLLSFAFLKTGFTIIRAIEKDGVAAETYAENIGNHIEVGDISQIPAKGKCDVLIAGPPCQGFSTLNKNRTGDLRNKLSLDVFRWAKKIRPSVVVIENVAAFLDSPESRELTIRFRRTGYVVTTFVLNAFDYGCPQLRRRSFTIASRLGVSPSLPKPQSKCQTVREAWKGLARKPNGLNQHYSPKPSEIALSRMKIIPEGGDKRDIMTRDKRLTPPSWWKMSGATDAWGRMFWDEPCNTLRTCFQNASKGRYIHPDQHRVISIREAARLHSIPDRWQFAGSATQITRQLGNSVPPALGRSIAREVMRILA